MPWSLPDGRLRLALWLRRLITVLLAGLVPLGCIIEPFIVLLVWPASSPQLAGYQWLVRKLQGRAVAAVLMTTGVAGVVVPIAWLAVVVRIELVRPSRHARGAQRRVQRCRRC
jgi:hypothetical protein